MNHICNLRFEIGNLEQWRTQEKFRWGVQGYGRPRRGSGGGKFSKIWKNFLRKLQKINYFSIFFKKLNKPCVNFSRVWTKNTNYWEILRNFLQFSKNFFRKFRKIHYFSIFFEKFNKPCVHFSRVWTANTNCWEFLRNFRKISKNFLRKFRKIHYFSIFFVKFNKPCVNFSRWDEKHKLLGKF